MFQPTLEPHFVNQIVSETVAMLTPEAHVLGIKIQFSAMEPDANVAIDKLRTQQILINLIQNSIKFSKKNDTISL